jgi:hypothetical protein
VTEWRSGDDVVSLVPQTRFATWRGTSFCAALVAGEWARALEQERLTDGAPDGPEEAN